MTKKKNFLLVLFGIYELTVSIVPLVVKGISKAKEFGCHRDHIRLLIQLSYINFNFCPTAHMIHLTVSLRKYEIYPLIMSDVHIWVHNLISTVPADILAPNGARTSAGTVLTMMISYIYIYTLVYLYIVIYDDLSVTVQFSGIDWGPMKKERVLTQKNLSSLESLDFPF